MNGVELTKAIRNFEKTDNIKKTYIIGMKESDDEEDPAIYIDSGMNEVKIKPFQIKLNEIVQ